MQTDPRRQDLGLGLVALLGSGSFGLHATGWAGEGPFLAGMLAVCLQNRWTARTSNSVLRLQPPRPRFFRVRMMVAMIVGAVLLRMLWREHSPVGSIDLFLAGTLAVEAIAYFRRAALAPSPGFPG